jgi:BRCA1-associated protein
LLSSDDGHGIKPVELALVDASHSRARRHTVHHTSVKLEVIVTEYNFFLAAQLEQQRAYFQEMLSKVEAQAQPALTRLEARHTALTVEVAALELGIEQNKHSIATQQKLASSLQTALAKAQQEEQVLQSLNAQLLAEQKQWHDKTTALKEKAKSERATLLRQRDEQIASLTEQLADLNFYMTAQKKIAKSGMAAEIAGGQLLAADPHPPAHHSVTAMRNRRAQANEKKGKKGG